MMWCAICRKLPDYPMHRFPDPKKYPQRFRIWVLAGGENLAGKTDSEIYKIKRYCSKHFEEKYHNNNSRLNLLAVPTLYLPPKVEHIDARIEDSQSVPDIKSLSDAPQEKDDPDLTRLLDDAVQVDTYIPESDFALSGESRLDNDEDNTHVKSAVEKMDSIEKPLSTSQDTPELQQHHVTSLTYITVPGKEVAIKISHALIEHDLAASVEILSETKSVYKSHGKVREDSKVILMAKTRSSRVSDLCEFAVENFPLAGYQIVSVPIENGNPHYLKWIADAVPPH